MKKIIGIVIGSIIFIIIILLWFFHYRPNESQKSLPPFQSSIIKKEQAISLDKARQLSGGIVTESLKTIKIFEEFQSYGTILPSQNFVDDYNKYISAQEQLLKAQANLMLSHNEYKRLSILNKEDRNISDKALQKGEALWLSDESNVRIAQASLETQKNTMQLTWGPIITDWIMQQTPSFIRLIEQQAYLIQITLPRRIQMSIPPQTARIQTNKGSFITVNIVSASPLTDPRIQGVSYFFLAPAVELGLLPPANVLAYLPQESVIQGVEIPTTAVVWWQGKAWVYLEISKGTYVRREIVTDIPTSNGWLNKKGFNEGDLIVITGAQLLLSQELRNQLQASEED